MPSLDSCDRKGGCLRIDQRSRLNGDFARQSGAERLGELLAADLQDCSHTMVGLRALCRTVCRRCQKLETGLRRCGRPWTSIMSGGVYRDCRRSSRHRVVQNKPDRLLSFRSREAFQRVSFAMIFLSSRKLSTFLKGADD
jgi:hypothetical protein